jgi:hypothetical protein
VCGGSVTIRKLRFSGILDITGAVGHSDAGKANLNHWETLEKWLKVSVMGRGSTKLIYG